MPIFGPFSPFFGQKDFFQKIWLCQIQHMVPKQHAEFQKKLRSQSQENFNKEGRKDGRTELEGQKDGQTLIHRTLPATSRGPKTHFYSSQIF